MFSSTRDLTATFRQATAKYGMTEAEYVFIFPWLQENANGASPFVGSDSESLTKVKQTYSNCILVRLRIISILKKCRRLYTELHGRIWCTCLALILLVLPVKYTR